MVAETKEYTASLPWAHAIGKGSIERLRNHNFAVIMSLFSIYLMLIIVKDWDPLINQVLETFPAIGAYPLEAVSCLKNLFKDDNVAFMGDAAHRKSHIPPDSNSTDMSSLKPLPEVVE
jgi:salicylate hydroxylase